MNKSVGLKLHRIVVASLLMSFLLLFIPVSAIEARSENKISELEKKISEAKKEKEKTNKELKENKETLSTLNSTTKTLKGTLNSLNNELDNVSGNLEKLELSIEATNQDMEAIEDDLVEAEETKQQQYDAMKLRIKYMYEAKSYDMFESILGATSFSDFLNKTGYFEALTSYDRQMLEKYKKTCEVINEAKSFLEEEQAELEQLHAAAKSEQNRVSELVKRTNTSIKNYQNEIAATEKEMLEQEELIRKQQESIKNLQDQLAEERRLSELASKSAWRNISQVSFSESDRKLLANIIYCEAGNQPYEGQVGVGAVVINRMLSSVFPDTVVGVVYQKNQFSPARSGRLALALSKDSATPSCYAAADAAMAGQTTVGNSLFFRLPKSGVSGIRIGGIVFY